jgi:hypothetical protein
MKIETLTTSLQLWHVNRNREHLRAMVGRKRKAAFLMLSLFAVVSAGVIAWILQS